MENTLNQTVTNEALYLNGTFPSGEGGYSDTDHATLHLFILVTLPILIVFGTVGNMTSLYVMRCTSLRQASTFLYLSVIAVLDTGTLWADVFVLWIQIQSAYHINPHSASKCALLVLRDYCGLYSSAIITMATLDKFVAFYSPVKFGQACCTVKVAKWICSISAIVYAVCITPLLLSYEVQGIFGLSFCIIKQHFWPTYKHLCATFQYYLPFAVLLISNIAIMAKFVKNKTTRRHSSQTRSTQEVVHETATRGTVTLLVVCVTFVISSFPMAIATYVERTLHPFTEVLVFLFPTYLYHSVKILVYCVVERKFRTAVTGLIPCYPHPRKYSHIENVTATEL